MGNCFRDYKVADNIEVIPPSEHDLEELPTFDNKDDFMIPEIVIQTDVRSCFRRNAVMVDLSKSRLDLILSTEATE